MIGSHSADLFYKGGVIVANTSRRYIDKNGKMFIPMNLEGGSWNEHFVTTPKLVCIAIIVFSAVLLGFYLADKEASLSSYITIYGIWAAVSSFILRFIVFEEKYYYRMYKQLKKYEITTPSVFWDIASVKDTMDGAILTYSDAKVAVLIKLERDTITGKHPDFKETHYDAISDFYKEIVNKRYSFVQLNIMERAGNDPRIDNLDKLLYSSDNANIRKLMELEIGHIKNITHHTLYESEYVLIYTSDTSKMDSIIDDAIDIVYKVLDGAFIGYKILRARDIIEIMKEEYGVRYFNYTEATLNMFKNKGIHIKNPFEITKIVYTDGDVQNVTPEVLSKINSITSDFENYAFNFRNKSLKEALNSNRNQNNKVDGVDFDNLSEGFISNKNTVKSDSESDKDKDGPIQNSEDNLEDQFIDF